MAVDLIPGVSDFSSGYPERPSNQDGSVGELKPQGLYSEQLDLEDRTIR